jgi:signal transduction protein with GAF and PtsI domain
LLAVDRDNPQVAELYQPNHPAVLSALDLVARSARETGTPCSVCGDMAEDPATAVLLLGMGYGEVSVAPHFFPEIKYLVRQTPAADARAFAAAILSETSIENVLRTLSDFRERLRAI